MNNENAVAAIRVSSIKQGLQGDSPEAQKEQIERFAEAHNITIKKFFVFMESASKEQQPVQEAIDYCKNPKNNIQLFIIKSIDRFTRGGSYFYDQLKMQLEHYKVSLVDIYGIIGNQHINTLEHLGVQYDWSVYNPTKKAEILEAERAKDEMRDIMSRMIGAEIRYVRMGYRVREAPFGYINEKVETYNGKRVILKPHPIESKWIEQLFQMRLLGTLSDIKIVEEINKHGFKTRKRYLRDPKNRTWIVGEWGGKPLHLKQFLRLIQNPIYAGLNIEKWTNGQPVKCKFKGIVSIDIFNKANAGKIAIVENDGGYIIQKNLPAQRWLKKAVNNPKFPYKRYVLCPHCGKPLYGSASRGKLGKYYPAYHCNKRGHYFRVSAPEMENTIKTFVRSLKINKEYVDDLKKFVLELWHKKQGQVVDELSLKEERIKTLQAEAKSAAEKMKMVSSEVAIKYLEEDLVKIDTEIKKLQSENTLAKSKDVDMVIIMENVGYFLEHLEELLIDSEDPLKKAAYFGLIFEKTPTYQELISGTPKLQPYLTLNLKYLQHLFPIGGSNGI